MSYMTLSTQEKRLFSEKNSVMTLFFTLFVLSRASDNTASQNIRGTDAWAVPHLKFWGTVPRVPPRSPPLYICIRNSGTSRKPCFLWFSLVDVFLCFFTISRTGQATVSEPLRHICANSR